MTRFALLAVALLAAACSQDVSGLRDHQVAGAAVTVHIVDSTQTVGEYTPAVAHVRAGETVAFVNASGDYHTVSFFSGPAGAQSSAGIAPGATFELTVGAPGVYRYRCRFHQGMVGEIIVAQP